MSTQPGRLRSCRSCADDIEPGPRPIFLVLPPANRVVLAAVTECERVVNVFPLCRGSRPARAWPADRRETKPKNRLPQRREPSWRRARSWALFRAGHDPTANQLPQTVRQVGRGAPSANLAQNAVCAFYKMITMPSAEGRRKCKQEKTPSNVAQKH